ncbi:MAG TPA: alpha-amylase family glycosyl hydrolase, partial [Elusimicrobiota bacterium]|nr:alpha-amylase family glycosyl hydrolase [Elusimicrobiota bacterium]
MPTLSKNDHRARLSRRPFWVRAVATATAGMFFCTQVVGATQVEKSFWEQRRDAAQKKFTSDDTAGQDLPLELHRRRQGLSSEERQLLAQLPAAAAPLQFLPPSSVSLPTRVTQGLPSPAPETPRDVPLSSLDLPDWITQVVLPYGHIRQIHFSPAPGAPLVVHIQDAHEYADAQKNISSLIESLLSERGISLVGLEGAAGGFNLKPYRAFPDRKILRDTADFLLRENLMGGAEHAGWVSEAEPQLWGVETAEPYFANIEAFRQALPSQPVLNDLLKTWKNRIDGLKADVYSVQLRDFDQKLLDQREGSLSLGKYVRYLTLAGTPATGRHPQLDSFVKALELEETLDFDQVEKERVQLIELLSQRLPEDSLDRLIEKSLLYRLGRLSYGDYHRYLKTLCSSNGIDLSQFVFMGRYIEYVLTAEGISRDKLFAEVSDVENLILARLLVTPEQKELRAISDHYLLIKKLAEFVVAPEDWLYFSKNRAEVLALPRRLNALLKKTGTDTADDDPDLTTSLRPFEDFCSLAVQRNDALLDNLLGKMNSQKQRAAILVAGGFHTQGLTDLMRRKNVSYVVVTPKFQAVDKNAHYLDFLARDKRPLEKLLSGEKITLKSPIVGTGALWNLAERGFDGRWKVRLTAATAAMLWMAAHPDGRLPPEIRETLLALEGVDGLDVSTPETQAFISSIEVRLNKTIGLRFTATQKANEAAFKKSAEYSKVKSRRVVAEGVIGDYYVVLTSQRPGLWTRARGWVSQRAAALGAWVRRLQKKIAELKAAERKSALRVVPDLTVAALGLPNKVCQDAHFSGRVDLKVPNGRGTLLCVFDGQGANGHHVAQTARDNVDKIFKRFLLDSKGDVAAALQRTAKGLVDWIGNRADGAATLSIVYVPDGAATGYAVCLGDSPVLWSPSGDGRPKGITHPGVQSAGVHFGNSYRFSGKLPHQHLLGSESTAGPLELDSFTFDLPPDGVVMVASDGFADLPELTEKGLVDYARRVEPWAKAGVPADEIVRRARKTKILESNDDVTLLVLRPPQEPSLIGALWSRTTAGRWTTPRLARFSLIVRSTLKYVFGYDLTAPRDPSERRFGSVWPVRFALVTTTDPQGITRHALSLGAFGFRKDIALTPAGKGVLHTVLVELVSFLFLWEGLRGSFWMVLENPPLILSMATGILLSAAATAYFVLWIFQGFRELLRPAQDHSKTWERAVRRTSRVLSFVLPPLLLLSGSILFPNRLGLAVAAEGLGLAGLLQGWPLTRLGARLTAALRPQALFSRLANHLPGRAARVAAQRGLLEKSIEGRLQTIYGDKAVSLRPKLTALLNDFRRQHAALAGDIPYGERLSERDAVLVSYGDSIQGARAGAHLAALRRFLRKHLRGAVNAVHFLPLNRSTSDRGFAPVKHAEVDPRYGTQEDIADIQSDGFDAMHDFVVNHVSASNERFQAFLNGDAGARRYFHVYDRESDLPAEARALVFRPRTTPLLTPFTVRDPATGKTRTVFVWTTFSADQIDLNLENEEAFLETVRALLDYAAQGARYIRLDAVGYL